MVPPHPRIKVFVDLLPSGLLFVPFPVVHLQLIRQILARLPRIKVSILEDEPCIEIDDSLFVAVCMFEFRPVPEVRPILEHANN